MLFSDLKLALPMLREAKEALGALSPKDLGEVAHYKQYSRAVLTLLSALCVLMRVEPKWTTDPLTHKRTPDYTAPAQRLLLDSSLLGKLQNFDIKQPGMADIIKELDPYIANPGPRASRILGRRVRRGIGRNMFR